MPHRADRALDQSLHLRLVGDVADERAGTGEAERFDAVGGLAEAAFVHVGEEQACAFLRRALRDRAADAAARRGGYEHGLALEEAGRGRIVGGGTCHVSVPLLIA